MSSQKSLYTISQAAKLLGVSHQTLRRWEKQGKILPERTLGNARRYSKEMLEEIKNARRYSKKILEEIKKAPQQKTSPQYFIPLLIIFFIVSFITIILLATYYLQASPSITSPVP